MVSVIVPVYNVEPYLRRCVDSILSQTYPDIEVILVDDGSTDNSGFICDEYAQKDERIRVIHKENGGVSSARNAGRKASTGAYIAFIDSDDWIDPIYFEVLLQGLEQTNAHICVVEPLKCDDKSIESNFVKHGIQFVVLHGDSIINNSAVKTCVWGRLFRREIIKDIDFDDGVMVFEDTPFNIKLYANNPDIRIAYTSARLYYYYQRNNSLVHANPHYHIHIRTAASYYLSCINNMPTDWGNKVILKEGFKAMLAAWYLSKYRLSASERREMISELRKQLHELLAASYIPIMDKIIYSVFTVCPSFYRLFRILCDPTMLDWEQNERKKKSRALHT